MIICEDWRTAPPEALAPLYEAECTRWYQALGWDYRPSCGLIEAARVGGRLPGLLARDERAEIVGWSYFLATHDALQIGNLVAGSADVARALLRAVVGWPDVNRVQRLSCFLFPSTAAIEQALRRARFSLLRHAYLHRPLAPDSSCARPSAIGDHLLREWSPDVVPDLLTLLGAAYAGTREARCFAPDGDIDQWATYVHQLVQTPACGRFERGLSFLVETGAGEMAGAILVTALSARIAHIAQMAVAPAHRGRGIGDWMVSVVCERARQARYEAVTLLVAESNQRARRLYDRNGFEPRADFLFADRVIPG